MPPAVCESQLRVVDPPAGVRSRAVWPAPNALGRDHGLGNRVVVSGFDCYGSVPRATALPVWVYGVDGSNRGDPMALLRDYRDVARQRGTGAVDDSRDHALDDPLCAPFAAACAPDNVVGPVGGLYVTAVLTDVGDAGDRAVALRTEELPARHADATHFLA